MLGTQGREKAIEENDSMTAISRLTEKFEVPLQAAAANVEVVACDFESLLHYAIQFISLSTLDYRAVWWRIFHLPSASDWWNVLILAKLLFSLPSSNGKWQTGKSFFSKLKSEPHFPPDVDIQSDTIK